MPKTKTSRVTPDYSVKPNSPAQAKRRGQRATLADILTLSGDDEIAMALYQKWPQKLPRLVRAEIGAGLLQCYQDIKRHVDDRRDQASLMNMVEERLALEALDMCPEVVAGVITLITSLSGEKKITCSMPNPLSGPLENDDIDGEIEREDGVKATLTLPATVLTTKEEDVLWRVVGMTCRMGGAIVMRHELPLRVQRKNELGVMEWVQQEKVYGCRVSVSGVYLLSAGEMKDAYMHDAQTGALLAVDPRTSFGDLAEHHKKLLAMHREPHSKRAH